MLGTLIGDLAGSVYEFRNTRKRDFVPFIHPQARFTDDTVCTVAIADALVNQKDPASTLKDWGHRYWDNGGWGQKFALWLASDDAEPYNSFGNGAAMRISPVALLAENPIQLREQAYQMTAITHNHPEGIKGALATSCAIYWARTGESRIAIRSQIAEYFGYDMNRSVDNIRPTYRHNESCQNTVPEALICALEAEDFEGAIRNAISLGGDSDTLAAIAGGLAETLYGIPEDFILKLLELLPTEMVRVMRELYQQAGLHVPLLHPDLSS